MPNFQRQVCPRSTAKETQLQRRKKSIFDAAGKIGKLEFLNDIGGGRIRQVMETLAISSNAIRVGSPVPDDVGGGRIGGTTSGNFAGSILERMQLGGAVQTAVAAFNPGAVNGAVGAARVLADDIQAGRFTLTDIPNRIQDFQNLEKIAAGIFTGNSIGGGNQDFEKFACRPSPYATDLVARAPKQTFMFIVEIKLRPQYVEGFQQQQNLLAERPTPNFRSNTTSIDGFRAMTDNLGPQLAFLVKTAQRPSINYDYEEVNYYNFRTKVARRATFNPVTMTFLDDQLNSAAAFYAYYTRAMSPITNINPSTDQTQIASLENIGMSFDNYDAAVAGLNGTNGGTNGSVGAPKTDSSMFPSYSASTGPLRAANGVYDTTSIIEEITIYQFGKNANTITAFTMVNPRITAFNPSDANMAESGDGQELGFDFDYDYFHIDPEIPMSVFTSDRLLRLSGEGAAGGAGARYPILNVPNDSDQSRTGTGLFENVSVRGVGSAASGAVRDLLQR